MYLLTQMFHGSDDYIYFDCSHLEVSWFLPTTRGVFRGMGYRSLSWKCCNFGMDWVTLDRSTMYMIEAIYIFTYENPHQILGFAEFKSK